MPEPSSPARPPRSSSTVVVIRDGQDGLEVLLMCRAERGDHNSSAWVFPGGLVDEADARAHAHCLGLDDAQASARLGLPARGLDYYIAALRECFEEAGLLYASSGQHERLLDRDAAAALSHWRTVVHRGERALADLCEEAGLRLSVDRLAYVAHWLTPPGRPKRFDTRFFLALAPQGQESRHDAIETVEHRWLRPAHALDEARTLKLLPPTRDILQRLSAFATAQEAWEWACAHRDIPCTMPRLGTGTKGTRAVLPSEPAWAEIGRLDPHGQGHVHYEIRPGEPVRLSERVIRVTANNGSVMTGPGTNTYLIGGGPRNEWAVLDPGPLDETHLAQVLAAAPGPIRWILVTHTHQDHSPGAAPLKARTGAAVLGRVTPHAAWQDATFAPDRALEGGERLDLPGGTTLRVLHTPGHASNHLCYLLEQERLLFTGDHLMQQSTVVINPPDGDMAAYLASLEALLDEPIDWLAPGHGFLMAQPRAVIEGVLAHRRRREAKVLRALRDLAPAPLPVLLERVYHDVPPALHRVASRSLLAHLLKLAHDGVAAERGEHWELMA